MSGSHSRGIVHVIAIAIVSTLSIGLGVGDATFWEPDEPRFAEATRQMFARGDFLTPYFNGVPRFEKPILFYWLQVPAFAAFGPTEFAARIPSALAGMGTVFVLYALARRIAPQTAAFVAALVLATTFRFVTYARTGLTDVPVMFFIVSALYAFVRASETPPSRGFALLGWACVGLGVLTKGPVGLLPVFIWASYAAVSRDWTLLARARPAAGIALATLIAAPWYIVMILRHGQPFVDFALGHEIAARVLSEESFAPDRGFFYYWKVWPGDAAPWSALVIVGAAWALFRWRQLEPDIRRPLIFAVTWFVCVFVLFSLSQSKVPHYVLPAYPAAALFAGVFVEQLAHRAVDRHWWRIPLSAVAVVVLAAAILTALFLAAVQVDRPVGPEWLVPAVLGGGAAAVGFMVWKSSLTGATYTLVATLAASFGLIGLLVVPSVAEPFKPMPRLAREADRVAPRDSQIGLLGRYGASSLIYYSHRNIQWLNDDDAAVAYLMTGPGAACVMPDAEFQRLAPRLHADVRAVARAEELNIRLERLLERRLTPGRAWVLVVNRPDRHHAAPVTR